MMNIKEALLLGAMQLKEAGIPTAALDGRLLLAHVLDKPIEY
jgi:hypothetical protein